MDFAYSDEQLAVAETATGLLGGLVTPERVMAVELTEDAVDRELWAALAGADLLGLGLPEAHGGAGYGITELSLLLQAQGNVVAPVPLWATLVLGALPLARFGSDDHKARWLPGVVAGDVMLTAAVTGAAQSTAGAARGHRQSRRRRLGPRRHRAGCAPSAYRRSDRRPGPHGRRRRGADAGRPGQPGRDAGAHRHDQP